MSSAADGYTSVAQSNAVASAFSLIKEEVMNFAENSKILISALDEVANLHPLIHCEPGLATLPTAAHMITIFHLYSSGVALQGSIES